MNKLARLSAAERRHVGGFSQKVSELGGQARQSGVAPGSPEAAPVVDQLLDGADAARRAYVRQRLATAIDSHRA